MRHNLTARHHCPRAEASSSGKARSAKAGGSSSAAGGGAASDEQPPSSADLLVKAVLLYPEAVVRLQVRATLKCWVFGLCSACGSSRAGVSESAGAAATAVLCVVQSTA